uniref:Uncharacterized protein n=1 Tax=Anguilla anguilla TaxID=7936 RepID=A0A0E9V5V4_ANGAN
MAPMNILLTRLLIKWAFNEALSLLGGYSQGVGPSKYTHP